MSTKGKSSPALRTPAAGTCPYCGQPLLTEQSGQHLRASELETQRKLDAALRALAAARAKEPALEGEPGSAGTLEPSVHASEVDKASEVHDFRLSVRQF